jgi:hypothetical protein
MCWKVAAHRITVTRHISGRCMKCLPSQPAWQQTNTLFIACRNSSSEIENTVPGISFSRCLQHEDYYYYTQWEPEVVPPFFSQQFVAVNRNRKFLLTQFHERYVKVALNCVSLYFILQHELHLKLARVQNCRTWMSQFPAYYSCQQKHCPYNAYITS